MKNFLSIDNLNVSSGESLREVIQSSSEMEGCPITNILESDEKTIWFSTEELPQEITINLSKQLFKEYPEKISAIGIYCWHAYPTNPKLIEIQISKNKGSSYISLGNFDLCLKPGRQLLQLDDDSDYILTKDMYNNDLMLKLIIKETFGDKRTYINNLYLYDDINLVGKQLLTSMEPIKEEDSNSMIYLRESRERTLPKSNAKEKKKSIINKNTNLNDLLELDFDAKSDEEKNKNKNININNTNGVNVNINNDNKIFGHEIEFMMSDSELSEKCNNFNLNANKEDDFLKIGVNEKKENLSIINNKKENENNIENEIDINNNEKINNNDIDSKKNNLKTNDRYFVENLPNEQFTKVTTTGKDEQQNMNNKEKSLNINDFNDDEDNEKEKDINPSISDDEFNRINNNYNDIDEQYNNSYREEDLHMVIEEIENYKKIQKQKVENYEKKLSFLENQFREMTILSNKMNNTINTILESQMNQKKMNHDNLLNSMRNIINERISNVFSNFNMFPNYPQPYMPSYTMDPYENNYRIPYNPPMYSYNYSTVGNINSNYSLMKNKIDRKIVKRYKIKSEKKILKPKNNAVSGRNKSGTKITYRKINNEFNNLEKTKKYFVMNTEENDSFSEYLNNENNENDFKNYPLQMANHSEKNIQNLPVHKKNNLSLKQRNTNNSITSRKKNSNSTLNSSKNYNYRLNTDINENFSYNKTKKIIGNDYLLSNNNTSNKKSERRNTNNSMNSSKKKE